jgi:tRNA threonylcarbamoyladenosine biosynthesis protein TsaE
MNIERLISNSNEDTISFGFQFAEKLKRGNVIALNGDLGAGKTEFVKGVCQFFKVTDIVTSPTFTIINQYNGILNSKEIYIFHLDLYRIKNEQELIEIGFNECMSDNDNIKFIEWSQNAGEYLGHPDYSINIKIDDDNENMREIEIIDNQN